MTATGKVLPPAGEPGSVAVLTSSNRSRLVLAGEIDIAVEAELAEAIGELLSLGLPVDIDARNIRFMDSSALSGIARLSSQLGHRPRMICPPESVLFLLDVTRVAEDVDVVDQDPGFEEDATQVRVSQD
ncbi:STAS domain-containing protein [Pseudactinotalea sp. Z1739]|uniref:STAS domain-containing protein n=1 Tax=Pseudactinotalea sp. Z1739 TaxID=3413028 RepID=UPI003C7CEBDF